MPTIIRIRRQKADKLLECAEKTHRYAKKLMDFIENEILDDEEYNERFGGGGSGMGGGSGNYREDDDEEDDDDYNERRGVPGTGRYGRSRYGRRRY